MLNDVTNVSQFGTLRSYPCLPHLSDMNQRVSHNGGKAKTGNLGGTGVATGPYYILINMFSGNITDTPPTGRQKTRRSD